MAVKSVKQRMEAHPNRSSKSTEMRLPIMKMSLLHRQGRYVLPAVIIIYVFLQTLTGYNVTCKHSNPFANWTSYYYFAAGFSFITSTAQQINRIHSCWRQSLITGRSNEIMFHLAAITVSAIAGSSSLLTFSRNHGGICTDVLGIDSSAAQWSEWITCVPLMAYIAVAVEDKKYLTRSDYSVITGLFLAVFSGMVMNLNIDNYAVGIFLFLFGSLALVASSMTVRSLDIGGDNLHFSGRLRDEDIVAATKKASLNRLIYIVFPTFPITYLFGYFGIIDRDQLYVGFVLLSVTAKLLFVNALIDEQISVTHKIKTRIEAERMVNETRRSFLRYVFHELRIPLNTITMGMAVIEDGKGEGNIADNLKEALCMMNGATSFINKTLNDVLYVHEIEEGGLTISKKPFHIEDVVTDAMRAVRGSLLQKNIELELDDSECSMFSESDIPLLIGDRLRLTNVIMSFIDNAIKLSSALSSVTVKLTKKYSDVYFPCSRIHRAMNVITQTVHTYPERKGDIESSEPAVQSLPCPFSHLISDAGDPRRKSNSLEEISSGLVVNSVSKIRTSDRRQGEEKCSNPRRHTHKTKPSLATQRCEVQLLVVDTGAGVCKEDIDGLMMPYSQIRPDHLEQGRGTGLWLVLAREIINLHGGEVVVISEVGKGSTFGFNIPFDIATSAQERTADLLKLVNCSSEKLIQTHQSDASLPITGHQKYLIVDDTPSNSKMLSMLLRGRNINCDIADNGMEALSLIKSSGQSYDFIFMDFTMPIMNGGDATSAIRESGFDRLIFGLTGNALNDDVSVFLEAGADCVLAKPLRAAQMDAILRHTQVHGFKSNPKVKFQMENMSEQSCSVRFL